MNCPNCNAENPPDSRFCHRCATPLQPIEGAAVDKTLTYERPPFAPARGTLFAGRYEIIEELGRGGMGRVYKVYDQKLEEVIALKLIHPEISVNVQAIERFRNELRFARKIGHRHVGRMFDLGEQDGQFYITMEYVEGENLKSFIRRSGHLTPKKAISLAKQVCEGLTEAHRMGVIHRDLKPQNIMIDREGSARIMDFGIARFTATEGLTGSGVMIGTPEYMSPEQVETGDVDKRTDIYALGIVLYEMVTGHVPFEGETPFAVMIKHKNERPRNPQDSNPLVSAALTGVILKCLEKEKAGRYQSAEELTEGLVKAETGLFQTEKDTMAKLRLSPKRRSRRWIWPVVGIVIVGGCLFVVWNQVLDLRKEISVAPVQVSGPEQHAVRIKPPPPPGTPGAGPDESTGSKTDMGRRILSFLSSEAFKKMSPKELREILDFDKQMDNIKTAIPDSPPISETWENAYSNIREGQRLRDEGRFEEALKRRQEGQEQMQSLLTMVAERDKALTGKAHLAETRTQVRAMGAGRENVLYRVAERSEREAEEAMNKGDFPGSRALFSVLEQVLRLSPQCHDPAECLKILANMTQGMKKTAEISSSSQPDPWLFNLAKASEEEARQSITQKDYDRAAEAYVRAAFLYQKIIDQGI
ncbi:MAG: protein kinase [Candidatus Aminicenantes bacterium]|nr:protein kinase [Candidatus Aminicenantes bacterium]